MKTIQLTDEQFSALSNGESITIEPPKKKQYKLKGGEYYIYSSGSIVEQPTALAEFGAERETKEQAERASKRMIRANRLSALACEMGGEIEFVYGEKNYQIYSDMGIYDYNYIYRNKTPERVYMTKKCAKEICTMLNAGEFSLGEEW